MIYIKDVIFIQCTSFIILTVFSRRISSIMLYHCLLPVALIATLGFQTGQAGYNRLNSVLVERVNNDYADSNFAIAENWLKEGKRLTPTSDVKQFLALKDVRNDKTCDPKHHQTMVDNVKETNLLELMTKNQVERRVDKIVRKIFLAGAKVCQPAFVARYKSKLNQLDKTEVKKAQTFAERVMDQSLFEKNVQDYDDPDAETMFSKFVLPTLTVKSLAGHERCPYKALVEILGNDSDSKYLSVIGDEKTGKKSADKKKLEQLVQDHLIAPCRYYVEKLGPEVFGPAELYKTVFKVNEADRDFYYGWSCFKVCGLFLDNKSTLTNDLKLAIENPSMYKYHS